MNERQIWMQRLLSVPLMVLSILVVHSFQVPNPMIVLIIPVVYLTYGGGYISGALSGATSTLYATYFFLVRTGDPVGGYKVLTIVLAVVSIILLVGRLKAQEERSARELRRRGDALAQMAATDKLTGAANRHTFFERANAIYDASRRSGSPVPTVPPGLEILIRTADSAMYRAKEAGRNRVVVEHTREGEAGVDERPAQLHFTPIRRRDDLWFADGEPAGLQDLLLSTIDQMLELVYVVDVETYELLYINSAGREKYGIGDPQSGSCHSLIHGLDKPCPFCLNQWLTQDSVYTWEFTNKMLDRHFLLRDRMVSWNGRRARMQIATDITQREAERRTLKNLLEAERVIRDCIGILYETKDFSEAMGEVLGRVGRYSGGDRAYFFANEGDAFVSAREWYGPQLAEGANRLRQVSVERFHHLWTLCEYGDCIVIEDMEQLRSRDEYIYRAFQRQGIENIVLMPLEQEGRVLGIWGVENPSAEKVRSIAPMLLSLRYFLLATMHRVEYEGLLQRLSFEDSLTKVRNRNRYLQDMERFAATDQVGVAYITINGLKKLNDTHGHAYGDQVLTACASSIRTAFPTEEIYRVGGDEFAVVCKQIPEERFRDCVRAFEAHCTGSPDCHAAVGYQWARWVDNIQELAQAAEVWMYEDKKNHYRKSLPGDRYRHYRDDVFGLCEPGVLEESLRAGNFMVYLQPKVSVHDRRVVGAEALVRYRQQDGKVIPPGHFLPILEDARLIGLLDFFVFDAVCQTLAQWAKEGREVLPVSVNFSRYTLAESDFLERLEQVFGGYGLRHHWMVVELTESVKGVEGVDLLGMIDRIREAGFVVSIDDFGVDYTNLSLFALATFDELKLDKSLVSSIVTSAKTRMVVTSVIDLCRRLGIRLVAEGVESEEQLAVLRQNGCEQAQGELFGMPIPLKEYEKRFLTPREAPAQRPRETVPAR